MSNVYFSPKSVPFKFSLISSLSLSNKTLFTFPSAYTLCPLLVLLSFSCDAFFLPKAFECDWTVNSTAQGLIFIVFFPPHPHSFQQTIFWGWKSKLGSNWSQLTRLCITMKRLGSKMKYHQTLDRTRTVSFKSNSLLRLRSNRAV